MLALLTLASFAIQGGGEYYVSSKEPGTGRFGNSAANLGDIDLDGVPDFIIGAPLEYHPTFSFPGAVHVYSGATKGKIFSLSGTHHNQGFGHDVAAAGDVNGDGVGDFLVGTRDGNYPGTAFVFSGTDSSLLYQYSGTILWEYVGETVSGLDDVDGDGFDDFLIAATGYNPPGLTRTGSVFAYSGRTGLELYRVDGKEYGDNFGACITVSKDLDHDGVRDFLVGAPFADPWNPSFPQDAGSVRIFSGATGQELFELRGFSRYGGFGGSISVSGDLTGDGIDDLVIGAGIENRPGYGYAGYQAGGVYLFSGADYSLLRRIGGRHQGGHLGGRVLITPDWNDDGRSDLLISEIGLGHYGLYQSGAVHLYSGRTGARLKRIFGKHYSGYLGNELVALGDLDGDHHTEILFGSSGIRSGGRVGSQKGGAFVYSFSPLMNASTAEISSSTGGSMTLVLDFPESQAGLPYRILQSNSGVGPTQAGGIQIPLTTDGALRLSMAGQHPSTLHGGNGRLDQSGNATAVLTIPANVPAALINTTRWFAATTMNFEFPGLSMVSVPRPLTITN